MAISVEGKYYFSFKIGTQRDFIAEGNLVQFMIVEETGNVLPTYSLQFTTTDEGIIRFLHQGIDLEVTFGKTINDALAVPLLIENYTVLSGGETTKQIYVSGHLSKVGYLSNPDRRILGKKSGVEAMKEVASTYFITESVDSNIVKSEDSQRWIQYNTSDKTFMDQIWFHSYLSESFIAIGITSEGNFVIKDVKALVSEEPRWTFTTAPRDEQKDIIYDADPVIDSSAGFINLWMGLGRDKRVYDLETGTSERVSEDVAPLMALTSKLTRRADLERRAAAVGVRNANVHSDFWRAKQRNLIGLSVFSSLMVKLSYQDQYNRIKILDPVLFLDTQIGGSVQTAQHHSGMYLVGNVTRELTQRVFTTTVELYREGANTPADSATLR